MATVKDILNDTRKFVQEKRASAFNEKQGLAGQDPNTYPGSQHDKPVDASMEQPDPGAKEDVNSPSGAYDAKGAKPANQKEQGTALEATDAPPASVKKEPAVSADAMAGSNGGGSVGDQPVAKHAELRDSLLSAIKTAQEAEKKASDDAPAEGEGEAAPAADDKEKPAEGDGEEPTKEGEDAPGEITLTQDVLAKIAETLLATEEGWELVEQGLSKAAGADAARETMSYLTQQEQLLEKQAAAEQGYRDAEELIKQAIYLQGVRDAQASMTPAAPAPEQEKAAETPVNPNAEILQRLGAALADASVKNAQADLAALAGGMPGAEMGGADMGAMGAMGGMPGADEAMAGMGGAPEEDEISPEELQEALAMMVQEGQISEEEAAAIMDYITSGEDMAGAEGAAAAEGADEAAAGEAAAAAGEGEEAGMEAAASANSLLAAIQRVKAAKA
jgi:hypothetical protein